MKFIRASVMQMLELDDNKLVLVINNTLTTILSAIFLFVFGAAFKPHFLLRHYANAFKRGCSVSPGA